MSSDARRAPASFVRTEAGGVVTRGEGEARVEDDALSVGPVRVSFLDVDQLGASDYRIALGLWPEGSLELSGLGRRYDAFTQQLAAVRSRARVAGLLAHGVTKPEVFDGAVLGGGGAPAAASLEVFDTHLTVVPSEADPWQLPLGALTELNVQDDPPAVSVTVNGVASVFGMLGRRRDAFLQAVAKRRDATAQALEALTGHSCFADGLGVSADRLGAFDDLLGRVCAPERTETARALTEAASAPSRLGFVQLLDPEGETLPARDPLPEPWAAFLLAPLGGTRTALEILSGVKAATYVFEAAIEEVNRDLQALHFRRGALALTDAQAALTPTNPYRLALRRLQPLVRLRAATIARILHTDGWSAAFAAAMR